MDGVFAVEIDGNEVAEIGPGAVVGERAALEGGVRTATLRATTRARVAAIAPDQLDLELLASLEATRRTAAPVG
jgi:CRP-like cAMP-binding protein